MLNALQRLSTWTVSLFCGLAVLAALTVGALSFSGYRLMPVVSGSMEPTLPVGSLVAVKGQSAQTLKRGDMVTFRHPLSRDKMVTHRLYQGVPKDGFVAWRTKGDANSVADPWLIRLPKETPTVRFDVPYAGYALVYLSGSLVRLLLLGAAAALVLLVLLRAIWGGGKQKDSPARPGLGTGPGAAPVWTLASSPRPAEPANDYPLALGAFLLSLAALGLVVAAVGIPTLAALTAAPITPPVSTTSVDRLANHFAAAPGTDVVVGTATPVAAGDVDTLALTFGEVPSARTFVNVFVVSNPTQSAQTAVLTLNGPSEVVSAVFVSNNQTSLALAAGAQATVKVTTSATTAGRGSGTLRLALSGQSWLYRDYAVSIDQAPAASSSLSASSAVSGVVSLSWGSSTTTNITGYRVYRATGAGSYSLLQTVSAATTSYDDTTAVEGTTYSYKVRAYWNGAVTLESLDSPVATETPVWAPDTPTAVSLANGGGVGSVYINNANKSSVSVAVTLSSRSLSTDTVTVTLTSGAGSVLATAAAQAGAGTVTLTGINASALADGAVTISARATSTSGGQSSATTIVRTKDTVAPTATDVQTANFNTIVGRAQASDRLTYSFSEPINPASLIGGWDGSAFPVTLRLSDGGSRDFFDLYNAANTLLTMRVASNGDYTDGSSARFSGSTITQEGSDLVVTLGSTQTGTAKTVTTSGATMSWTVPSGITDLAGNACTTSSVSESGPLDVEF